MTPSRTGKRRGNFEIDRVFKNVGRIRKSLGTSKIREFRRRESIIEKLYELHRYDVLRAFRDGEVTIEQLVEADLEERLGATLTDMRLTKPLWEAIEETLPRMGKVQRTRDRYEVVLLGSTKERAGGLKKKAAMYLGPDATIQDLASVPWDELRAAWGTSAADWGNLRVALSSFLSRVLNDKYHPFARKFRSTWPAERIEPREPNLSIEQFLTIVGHAPKHAAAGYWILAITGMRVGEYLSCKWKEHVRPATRTILVPGTKTAGSRKPIQVSERLWGYIEVGIPCALKYDALRDYWITACKKAGIEDVRLHDLRHSHAQWSIDAGVAESKVQRSLRHDDPRMTRRYALRNATREVSEALALRLLGPEPEAKEETA